MKPVKDKLQIDAFGLVRDLGWELEKSMDSRDWVRTINLVRQPLDQMLEGGLTDKVFEQIGRDET